MGNYGVTYKQHPNRIILAMVSNGFGNFFLIEN